MDWVVFFVGKAHATRASIEFRLKGRLKPFDLIEDWVEIRHCKKNRAFVGS